MLSLNSNCRSEDLAQRGCCQHCQKTGVRLEAHHVIYREQGGKDALMYQTATLRKARGLPKEHDGDALCLATYESGGMVPSDRDHFSAVSFRPRRTRRQYHDLPCQVQGRVKYQVNGELEGFRKGDVVRVKGKFVKQINSIYSEGRLAFKRVKGEPASALPKDCQLLERGRTLLWEKGSGNTRIIKETL